jgi:hypothetical protein
VRVQAVRSDRAVQSRLSRGFVVVDDDDAAEVVGFSGFEALLLLFSFTRMMRRS